MLKRNLLLLLGVILLAAGPLAFHSKSATFGGSDDQASALISSIKPDYHRWVLPLWQPPSSEIESLLFAVQAGFGTGILGYYFGRRRGLAEARGAKEDRADH